MGVIAVWGPIDRPVRLSPRVIQGTVLNAPHTSVVAKDGITDLDPGIHAMIMIVDYYIYRLLRLAFGRKL